MILNYKETAFLEVDIQNDFCPAYTDGYGVEHPAGALAVQRADEIIGPLNSLAEKIRRRGGKVLAAQDWHPAGHISFAASHGKKIGEMILVPVADEAAEAFERDFPFLTEPVPAAMQQFLWPVHCVQDSPGAAFHGALDTSHIDFVFRKGYRKNIDSYSAFFENDRCTPTDLYPYLKEQGITTILIGGLATDYCVLYSVIDSLRLGFTTYCVADACMGIGVPAGSLERAERTMKEKGAVFITTADIEG